MYVHAVREGASSYSHIGTGHNAPYQVGVNKGCCIDWLQMNQSAPLFLHNGAAIGRITKDHRGLGVICPLPHRAVIISWDHLQDRPHLCVLSCSAAVRGDGKTLSEHEVQEARPDATCKNTGAKRSHA